MKARILLPKLMRQNHALNPWGKLPIHELCKSQMGQALCNCAQHCNATVYTRNTMQLCIITKSTSVQLRAAGFSQKYAKLVGSSTIYGFLLAPRPTSCRRQPLRKMQKIRTILVLGSAWPGLLVPGHPFPDQEIRWGWQAPRWRSDKIRG